MAIRYYDDALCNKINGWITQDTELSILRPNETELYFKLRADQNNDKPLKLPLIAISRSPDV